MSSQFPGKGKVAVLKTSPETILEDIEKLMKMADVEATLPNDVRTGIKINVSWQTWYPACSSTPWQLEGVIKTLKGLGYQDLVGVHNDTVVVNTSDAERNNKHRFVTDQYGVPCLYLYNQDFEWQEYQPKQPFLVLDKVYPNGVFIPKALVGMNMVHLPTVKCVHPDTQIVLSDGSLVRIADLVDGALQHEVALIDADGDIRIPAKAMLLSLSDGSAAGPQATRYFWRTPLKGRKIWRIRTKTGREVKVSSEHPFLVPGGWLKAASLQVGDRIAIPRKIAINGKSQPLPKLEKTYGKTSTKELKIPEKTSPEFWRWIGYFIAEGWVQPMRTTCRFWWSNGDPILQQDFIDLTNHLFGLKVVRRKSNPNDHYTDSLQMQEFFEKLGISAPMNAGTKHVPELLFRCPDEEIAAFLEGYFDGDGSVGKKDGLHVITKSIPLANEVQYLLNRLGVIAFHRVHWSTVNKEQPKQPCHMISVYADELVTLHSNISLKSVHKQDRLDQLVARRLRGKRPSNWDTIPVSPQVFRTVRQGLGFSQSTSGRPSGVNNIENGYTLPVRPVLQYFLDRFLEEDTDHLYASEIGQMGFLAREDIAWDHVVTVEEIEGDTEILYDFTMESMPNFVGNGIFLHNTHVFTTITGAMKNAFGGLLHRNRHWTHSVIHDTLVDLLMIQQDIHPGIFAVMDGTFAGDGPGPRAMRWHEKDILLASADQVAIDAVSAKLQGFDPMNIRFIRRAHELSLGVGDPRQIEIAGYDIDQEMPWHFVQEDTFASRGQKLIYHGPLKPLEKVLLQSPIVPWSYFASNFYHNVYWYPFVGRHRVEAALQTKWGRMFQSYGDGQVVMPGMEPKTVVQAGIGLAALAAGLAGMVYLLNRRT